MCIIVDCNEQWCVLPFSLMSGSKVVRIVADINERFKPVCIVVGIN